MVSWLTDNAVTIIVIATLLIAVGAATFSLIKDKKNGCACNCATCKINCTCNKQK